MPRCSRTSAGEIVLFDRSWYNRAGVERVMGLPRREVEAFLEQRRRSSC
jgi:polyphosphate kinase 2 (PPK2 family)